MPENTAFRPDWSSPPGDTIAAILAERGLTRGDFALAIDWKVDEVDDLICGNVEISAKLAGQLANVLGSKASFWSKRESHYRQDLERQERRAANAETVEWFKAVPSKEMSDLGWIQSESGKSASAAACLQFFGVPSVSDWNSAYQGACQAIAFRTSKSFASEAAAVAAWLRQGEIVASEINCGEWDPKRFRKELERLRGLTREKDPDKFLPELIQRCAACGVAVVLLRAPKKCKASGAARFLSNGKPLILLSARHLSDDHLWFTFFHEAGHILLHGDRFVFVDGLDDSRLSEKEETEANQFAADILVPPEHQAEMMRLRANKIDVMRFAKRIGVSRGIIVGQLQHKGVLGRDQLTTLKYFFKWHEE